MTLREMATEYNRIAQLVGKPTVKRFSDRAAAERRLAQLQRETKQVFLVDSDDNPSNNGNPSKEYDWYVPPPVDVPVTPCRVGSIQAKMIDVLRGGCTRDEIARATGWSHREISAGLSWYLKLRGYGVARQGDTYTLVVPEGETIPEHSSRWNVNDRC